MPRRNFLWVPEPRPRVRKWDREAREGRLKSAVFAAMTESRGNPLSPSEIARHAKVSKALIYKHFGSVEALVDDAILSCLDLLDLDISAESESGAGTSKRLPDVAAKLHEKIQSQPELGDLIGWSLGNPDPRARKVAEAVRAFCEDLAARAGGGTEAATFLLGVVTNAICQHRNDASEDTSRNIP